MQKTVYFSEDMNVFATGLATLLKEGSALEVQYQTDSVKFINLATGSAISISTTEIRYGNENNKGCVK